MRSIVFACVMFSSQIIYDFGQIERKIDDLVVYLNSRARIEERARGMPCGQTVMAMAIAKCSGSKLEKPRFSRWRSCQTNSGKALGTAIVVEQGSLFCLFWERLFWQITNIVRNHLITCPPPDSQPA